MTGAIVPWAPDAQPLGRCVVAIGAFDGVHLGHQQLIRDLIARARVFNTLAVVLTFDRDPELVVMPEQAAPQIMRLDDRLEALVTLGADALLVVPFDQHVAALSPDRFVDELLLHACTPLELAVGEGFRFGARAAGDVAELARLGMTRGFGVHVQPLVSRNGLVVSSTRIRTLLSEGAVADAAALLTRPHRVRGTVVHGRGEGRAVLGIPTANLETDPSAALPAEGVYAGVAHVGEQTLPAAISVGRAPTFDAAHELVEAHLIGYAGPPLYGTELVLDFYERLSSQQRFATTEGLISAIRDYVAAAEQIARTWAVPEAM